MTKFPTYGMAGIGIAAAIGFVFALSFVSNNNAAVETGGREEDAGLLSSEPSSLLVQHKSGGDQGMAAERTQAEDDGMPPSAEGDNASMMMQQQKATTSPALLTLASITASDGITGEAIGDVVPEMQFEMHRPVFIKSSFVNANDAPLPSHLITMGIGSKNDSSATFEEQDQLLYQQAATFHGDIGANGSVELELYWNPTSPGEYALLLFSVAPEDLASSGEPIRPVESIPIRVVQNTS